MYFPLEIDKANEHPDVAQTADELHRKTLLELVDMHQKDPAQVTSAQLHTAYWGMKKIWYKVVGDDLVKKPDDEIPNELLKAGTYALEIAGLKVSIDARINALCSQETQDGFDKAAKQILTDVYQAKLSSVDRINIFIHLKNTSVFWALHHSDPNPVSPNGQVAMNGHTVETTYIPSPTPA